MAWVRPKHPPKPKPKADPVDTLVPMLSYISNRRVKSRSTSPTKNIPPVMPISRDPILRSLQQAQAQHAEDPIVVYEEDEDDELSEYQPRAQSSLARSIRDTARSHQQPAQRDQQRIRPSTAPPARPPPPPIVRQKPRVPSYERPRPVEIIRERIISEPVRYPVYGEPVSPRAMSARWANATTPLDLR